MSRIVPALLPAVSLAVGIALGIANAPSASPLALAVPMLAVMTALCAYAGVRPRIVGAATAIGCLVCGLSLGARAATEALDTPLRAALDRLSPGFHIGSAEWGTLPEPMRLEGTLLEDASVTADGVAVTVDVETVWVHRDPSQTAGTVRAIVSGELARAAAASWRAGRRIRAPVLLRRPPRYLDDGVRDDERQLALRGTTLLGVIKSGALVEVTRRAPWWTERASALRAWARRVLGARAAVAGHDAGGIVTAILIGDRAGLTAEVRDRLQRAGTYHVIAISGGNIALLVATVLAVLTLGGLTGRWPTILAIAIVVAYALVVAGGASVTRATVMAAICLGARLLDHRSPPLNAAAVTVLVMLAARPLDLVDAGFVLTVGATVGIIVAASGLRGRLPRRWWLRAPAALLAASAAAEIALLPLGAWSFSRVTIAGLVLNFAAIPLMSVAQVSGMLALLSAPLAPLSTAAGSLASWAAAGLVASARLVDLVPALAWRVPPPAAWLVTVYYAALVSGTAGWRRWNDIDRWRRWSERAVVATACAAAIAIACGAEFEDRRPSASVLRVTSIDVGQGDATLVQFPDGRAMLVDAGGGGFGRRYDLGARIVAPALWARGVRRLTWLLLTHGDPDHIGGAMAVLPDFRPREVWEGVPVEPFQPLTDLHARAAALGLAWRQVYAGTSLEAGGVRLQVWHPPPADWDRMQVRNNDSLVVELRYGGVSILLPGDAERETEQRLVPRFRPAALRVMKMAHHGSRSSSAERFVAALRPDVAVASSGRGNRFGHPAPDVVARYEAAGASVWRTDRDGEITLETDGRTLTIRSYTGRTATLHARQ